MLEGDFEAVESFVKDNSDYGPLICALERIKSALADVQKPITQQMHGEVKQKCGMASDGSCVHKRGEFCIADIVWFDHCEFRVV